jgi:peptidylprolyl isomerase
MPLFAQTKTPAHTTPTLHRPAATACAQLPELSPKIPALPAGTPCPKPLYTITEHPSISLDYAAPIVSPELREILGPKPSTFSLDYVDTRIGAGPLALPHKWYTVHYTGYLLDGTKFDSSVDRGEPISFPYGGHRVIEGWDTGFEGMHVGGKRRLFVPYQLAYGENGRPPTIPAKSMLVFDVELVAQSDTQPPQPQRPALPRPGPQPGALKSTPPASPAGAAAPPPVNSTTPATSTQPAQPTTSSEPKKQ